MGKAAFEAREARREQHAEERRAYHGHGGPGWGQAHANADNDLERALEMSRREHHQQKVPDLDSFASLPRMDHAARQAQQDRTAAFDHSHRERNHAIAGANAKHIREKDIAYAKYCAEERVRDKRAGIHYESSGGPDKLPYHGPGARAVDAPVPEHNGWDNKDVRDHATGDLPGAKTGMTRSESMMAMARTERMMAMHRSERMMSMPRSERMLATHRSESMYNTPVTSTRTRPNSYRDLVY